MSLDKKKKKVFGRINRKNNVKKKRLREKRTFLRKSSNTEIENRNQQIQGIKKKKIRESGNGTPSHDYYFQITIKILNNKAFQGTPTGEPGNGWLRERSQAAFSGKGRLGRR